MMSWVSRTEVDRLWSVVLCSSGQESGSIGSGFRVSLFSSPLMSLGFPRDSLSRVGRSLSCSPSYDTGALSMRWGAGGAAVGGVSCCSMFRGLFRSEPELGVFLPEVESH